MLITFVGCPASGKTTTAAMLFAKLKEMGIAAEFICEQARLHIARIRWEQALDPKDPVALTDNDQLAIMEAQWNIENMLTSVCGNSVVVVSDSSALNALLYMNPALRDHPESSELLTVLLEHYEPGICFYTPPLAAPHVLDPNRVHDEAMGLRVDSMIPEILKSYAPGLIPVRLDGNPQERLRQALDVVLEALKEKA